MNHYRGVYLPGTERAWAVYTKLLLADALGPDEHLIPFTQAVGTVVVGPFCYLWS